MKNNKGYTLVELLVTLAVFAIIMAEVGNMIMNSSRLYRNGTYEVELQTEAQQIVQQMEELLIDVNHSVSTVYYESLSSDFITISNNTAGMAGGGDYTIYNFTLDRDPVRGYGTLYFSKTSSDGSDPVTAIPMAEYVQSISLDMDGYASDVVTLNVSMNNGRYGYQASQDIYLRNSVGSGGGGSYNNSAEYQAELVVLRYRVYDLDDVVAGLGKDGESFTYAWDASDTSMLSRAAMAYILTGNKLKHTSSYNNKSYWNTAVADCKLIATGDMGSKLNIRVRTDKVGYGSNDHAVVYQNVDSNYPTMTPVPVYGIDVSAADHITVEMLYNDGSGMVDPIPVIQNDDTVIDGNPQATYYFPSEAAGARLEMKFSGMEFGRNENDNTIEVTSSYMNEQIISHSDGTYLPAYYDYIKHSGETIRFRVSLDYGGDIEEIVIHTMPVPTNDYPSLNEVDADVANKFWQAVGF